MLTVKTSSTTLHQNDCHMPAPQQSSTAVDKYIDGFPSVTKKLLQQIRSIIRKAAPDAEECISYQMPAYKQQGMLVFFAGYDKHIGFYPTGSGIGAFQQELTKFQWSKGAVQFPLDKPLPSTLITKMVKFKLKENKRKAELKTKSKK
jgi:uncharacterized protein YdhG (YjbR/CyaY superfamily)